METEIFWALNNNTVVPVLLSTFILKHHPGRRAQQGFKVSVSFQNNKQTATASCFWIIIYPGHHYSYPRHRLTFHTTEVSLWCQCVARFTALPIDGLFHEAGVGGGWGHLQCLAVNLPHYQSIFIHDRRAAAVQNISPTARSGQVPVIFGLLRSLKVLVTPPTTTLIKHAESICLASSWGSDGELTQAGDWFINTDFGLWDRPDDDSSASGISMETRRLTCRRWTLMDSNVKDAQ